MTLAAISLALLAAVALVAACLLHAAERPVLGALRAVAPAARARWLLLLSATPLLAGLGVLVLTLGHCVGHRMLGEADDCVGPLGQGCTLCVFHAPHMSPAGWALAAVALTLGLHRVAALLTGLWHSVRVHRRVAAVGRPDPRGFWSVPGAAVFVVGLARPRVCVGEELERALDPLQLAAITAHERGHHARRDLWRRLLARLFSVALLPGSAERLLAALDLAIEQACDECASNEVEDPLVVAQTLIDVARIQGSLPGARAGIPSSLPERVEALCAPPVSFPQHGLALGTMAALAGCAALGYVFDHQVHATVEAVTALVAR